MEVVVKKSVFATTDTDQQKSRLKHNLFYQSAALSNEVSTTLQLSPATDDDEKLQSAHFLT